MAPRTLALLRLALLALVVASTSFRATAAVTGCPSVPGYDVLPDSDVSNADCNIDIADVYTANATAAALLTCDQNDACMGFCFSSSTGAARQKSCLRPTQLSPGSCLYTKLTNTACPSYTGYARIPDVMLKVSTDDVATYGTYTDLASTLFACDTSENCGGFTFDASARWGGAVTNVSQTVVRKGACSYTRQTMSCPTVTGYSVATDVDIEGETASSSLAFSSSATLASILRGASTACDMDPTCQGFNSKGQLKLKVLPLSAAHRTCFYTKMPTSCTAVRGYTAIPDRDHTGGTVAYVATTTAARDSCELSGACKGFNSLGEVKSSAAPLTLSRGTCFYARATTVCTPYSGYDVQVDMNTVSARLGNFSSATSALAACDKDPSCNVFNSLGETFKSAGMSQLVRGVCQYIKIKKACTAIKGYAAVSDSDVSGFDLSTATTPLAASQACNANADCKGFNGAWRLKSSVESISYVRNSCFYIKAT